MMKGKMKVLPLCMTALLTGVTLSGCGTTGNNAKNTSSNTSSSTQNASANQTSNSSNGQKNGVTTVTMWDFLTGGDGATMKSVISEFEKTHPSIQIKETTEGWGSNYGTKLITSILAGKSPDLALAHGDFLVHLQNSGVLDPVDSEVKASGMQWSQFSPLSLKYTEIKGQHYAIPLDVNTFLLYYNKSVLKKDGVALDSNGQLTFKNYSDFVNVLNQIKQHGDVPLDQSESGYSPMAMWYSFYDQMGGGDLLNSSNTKTIFMDSNNKSMAIKAMQDVVNLYKSNLIPANIKNTVSVFESGKTAFDIDGTWSVNAFDKALKGNLGVTVFPQLFGTQKAAYGNSHVFVLPVNQSRTAQQTKAAMTFVKWVTDNEWLWSKAGHIPANKATLQTPQFKAQAFRTNYDQQIQFVRFWPATKSVWFVDDSQIYDILQKILLGKLSVTSGLQQISNTINNQLAQG